MTDNPEVEHKAESEKRTTTFDEISRKLVVAAVTAAVFAQDELNNFVERMVEKGEIAEQDARRLVQEALERREKLEKERAAMREKAKTASSTSAEDTEALEKRIEELKQQIEALKTAHSVPPVEGNPQ